MPPTEVFIVALAVECDAAVAATACGYNGCAVEHGAGRPGLTAGNGIHTIMHLLHADDGGEGGVHIRLDNHLHILGSIGK